VVINSLNARIAHEIPPRTMSPTNHQTTIPQKILVYDFTANFSSFLYLRAISRHSNIKTSITGQKYTKVDDALKSFKSTLRIHRKYKVQITKESICFEIFIISCLFDVLIFSNHNGQKRLRTNATTPAKNNLSVSIEKASPCFTHRQKTIVTNRAIKWAIGNFFIAFIQFQKIEESFVFIKYNYTINILTYNQQKNLFNIN